MPSDSILKALEGVLIARKTNPTSGKSYVASLYDRGLEAIGGKVIEEAAETVEAADEPGEAGREHLIREAADLLFHTLVLLAFKDVPLARVEAELARRFGVGGLEEKASRQG